MCIRDRLNFSCKFCGKKFYNKGNLNQHEVIHTGVTPYQCHVCGKHCKRKSELEKHVSGHVDTCHDSSGGVAAAVVCESGGVLPVCVPGSMSGVMVTTDNNGILTTTNMEYTRV